MPPRPQEGGRRPFGVGPSSRHGGRPGPGAQRREVAGPSGSALHRGADRIWSGTATGAGRRPFGVGPSSRPHQWPSGRTSHWSPALRGRPFIEAATASDSPERVACRRPFGVGPSSRPAMATEACVAADRRRPFGVGPSSRRGPVGVRRHKRQRSPALRGRPFIEARPPTRRPEPSRRVAGPSGSALHRGEQTTVGVRDGAVSPALRGRPFIEAARP